MKRIAAPALALIASTFPACAETSVKAGLWKITTMTIANGIQSPPRVSARCLTPDQARDVNQTFSPEFGGVNSACERTQFESKDQKLSWRLQCKGQFDMDVVAEFLFDSDVKYRATISTKGTMAGQQVVDSKQAILGEHDGDCP
jgi:hypothetical protein